jgi:hypothetical protein
MRIRKTRAGGIRRGLTADLVFGLFVFLSQATQKDARAKQAGDKDHYDE